MYYSVPSLLHQRGSSLLLCPELNNTQNWSSQVLRTPTSVRSCNNSHSWCTLSLIVGRLLVYRSRMSSSYPATTAARVNCILPILNHGKTMASCCCWVLYS